MSRPKQIRKRSMRRLVEEVLSPDEQKLMRQVSSQDPEFLTVMVDLCMAKWLALHAKIQECETAAERRALAAEHARLSEELRKFTELRVKAQGDTLPERIEIEVLGM